MSWYFNKPLYVDLPEYSGDLKRIFLYDGPAV